MNYNGFGATDLRVSEIGFGCARLGGFFSDVSRDEMVGTLRQALDQGITFFDTADMYTQGESERLLGDAFRGRRDQVVLASKVGYRIPTQRRMAAGIKPLLRPLAARIGLTRRHLPSGVRGALSQDFSKGYIESAVRASLKRLRTDRLDLYQLHSPPTAVIERGECFETLERLQQRGEIRYYGVSCETVADAHLCMRYPGISALQLPISLLEQGAIECVLPWAQENGVAVVARECFAGGLLAKPVESRGRGQPASDQAVNAEQLQCILEWNRIAHDSGRSLRTLALQFVAALPGVSVTLVGMRTGAHLSDALRSINTPPLDDAVVAALQAKATAGAAAMLGQPTLLNAGHT